MGYAMASNIRKKMDKSATLYINDVNASACTRFKDEYSSYGPIEIVSTAREAADNAKVVVSIVPAAKDVKTVYLDEKDGVIAASKDDERVSCECSTIDVKSTREVGEKLKAAGMGTYVDTPVSVSLKLIFLLVNFPSLMILPPGWCARSRARRPSHAHWPPYTFKLEPCTQAS